MTEYEAGHGGTVVRDQAVVDFSHLTAPEQLASIGRIEDVALVIVPEALAAAYAAIPAEDIASTVYVPEGANVRVHTGVLETSGDGLGAANDVLIVTGMLIVTSPVTGPVPKQIHVVGSVFAPRGSQAALGPALAGCTGAVSYFSFVDGQDTQVLMGQSTLSVAMLANPLSEGDDVLIVAGQVVITGEIEILAYRQLLVAGQLAAPAASRNLIEPRVRLQGQAAWYRGDEPRVFYEETCLGADFFGLLDRPVSLIAFANLTIAAGVTEAMLREKVSGISAFDDIIGPPELLGVLQFLTTDVFGTVRADSGLRS